MGRHVLHVEIIVAWLLLLYKMADQPQSDDSDNENQAINVDLEGRFHRKTILVEARTMVELLLIMTLPMVELILIMTLTMVELLMIMTLPMVELIMVELIMTLVEDLVTSGREPISPGRPREMHFLPCYITYFDKTNRFATTNRQQLPF